MKKFTLAILLVALSLKGFADSPKYVFYFIGDGMGVNVVNLTQIYKASLEGRIGTAPLVFTEFPVVGLATTWSANSVITDSAASGTALATGSKTDNRAIGKSPDGTPVRNAAEIARSKGRKVAIVTTVGLNDATPAAFSAHQDTRNNCEQIIVEQAGQGYDFYGGGSMKKNPKNRTEGFDGEAEFAKAGYTIVRSRDDFKEKSAEASKIAFLPDKKHAVSLAIDRDENSTTLSDMLSSSIEFLMRDSCSNGFFIMAEGGRIDHCAHGNDAASMVREVLDLSDAVGIAYRFYLEHPDQTAIIVTADHDTGGCSLTMKDLSAARLQWQKHSAGRITDDLKKMMEKKQLSWKETKKFLSEQMGLWSKVKIKPEDEAEIRGVYDSTVALSQAGSVTDEYNYNAHAAIVAKAREILNKYAGIVWITSGHSAGVVPVYYIGSGAELFSGMLDNAIIGTRMKELIGN